MSRIRLLCSLLLLLLLLPTAAIAMQPAAPALQGKVLWIYDGDTLKIDTVGKVRLIGIDTPEKSDSPRDDFLRKQGVSRKVLRRTANDALQFCIAQVKGRQVTLTLDDPPRDRHGRLLAYVHLPDGRLLNQVLLEEGLAVVYRRFDFRRKADFLAAEQRARTLRRGLWIGLQSEQSQR